MSFLKLFSKKRENRSVKKIWDEYGLSFFKKCELSEELVELIESSFPNKAELVITKVEEIEKLIPVEIAELEEETLDLYEVMKEAENLKKSLLIRTLNLETVVRNREELAVNAEKLIQHMNEALEKLIKLLKTQNTLIKLIKKEPLNRELILSLFQSIVSTEKSLARVFGNEIEEEDGGESEYKKIERIVHAALTGDKNLKVKISKEPFEPLRVGEVFPRRIKRLDYLKSYFNSMLDKLGESEGFEILYTETAVNSGEYIFFIRS